MSLILEIIRADGSLVRQPLAADAPLAIHAGDRVRVIDTASGQALPPEALLREGADLVVATGDERIVARGLFGDDADGEAIDHALSEATDTAGPVEAQSLAAIDADGGDPSTIAAANGAAAAAAEPEAGGPGPFDASGTAAFGAVAAGGVALVASGSSGGSSSPNEPSPEEPAPEEPPPVDTTPPEAPVLAPVAGDDVVNAAEAGSVVINGIAEPGSTVTVEWSDGATVVSGSAVADASGNFAVALDPAGLADGATTVSATATDAAGNVGPAASAAVTLDRTPPAAPSVALDAASDSGLVGDDITNNTTPTLAGTADAGATVSVTYVDASGTARSQSTTADASGAWSMTIANAVAGHGATVPFTASAADAAGNTASTTVSLVFDTVSMAPSLRVDLDTGAAHGFAEAGATVALDHDGNAGTAALETVAGSDGAYAFAAGTIANAGQVASATATDVAGNTSSAATVTMPGSDGTGLNDFITDSPGAATIVGLGGDDFIFAGDGNDRLDGGLGDDDLHGEGGDDIVIGGPGNDVHIFGEDGNDILIGDSGGGIRNYQFDYWNTSAPDAVDSGDGVSPVEQSFAGLRPSASIGWTIDPNPATRMIDDGAGGNVQVRTGGLVELLGTANVADHGPDLTGTGGTLYWETEFTGSDGASALSQPIITSAGVSYELAIQTSSFDGDTSFAVVWNGQEIAFYNGLTDTWSGQQPDVSPVAPGDPNILRQVLRFEVDGNPSGEDSSLALRAFAPIGQDGGDGLQVDRVTLRPTAADGNDYMNGGAGDDLLFGQGGDDTLIGGAGADTFVFSMHADNGHDTILDFELGTDRILLIDALDASRTGSLGPAAVPLSDSQLDASDFLVAGTQEIMLADSGGNLQLVFSGEGGAALGSVTLNGVAAGAYADVGALFGAGILVATGDGFHAGLL